MAVRKISPYVPTNKGWGNAATVAKKAAPAAPKAVPKPVIKKPPARPLPGNPNWSQAAEYGWTGSPDPNVVSRATQFAPEISGDYSFNTGGGGGGAMPGWGIDVGMLESQRDEDIGSFRSGMGTRIKQALIDLGLSDVSQLNEQARSYVDDATLEAAKQNKYSLFAQLQQKANRATAKSRAALAARGMLSSGQLTKEAKDVLEESEQARYAGVREFSGGIGDLMEQYASRQREWANKIAEARMQAAASGYGGYGGGGGGGGGGPEFGTGVGRPGEWADLPVLEGWQPGRNTDARYDMSGATPVPGGYIGPQGQRYDENGRVI